MNTGYAITFTGRPPPNANNPSLAVQDEFLWFGQTEMASEVGMVVPADARITTITTNQDGTTDSDFDILVNDIVVETVAVTNRDHVFILDHTVVAGDRITAFNQNIATLIDFNMTLYFDEGPPPVADPDAPFTVRDEYRLSVVNAIYTGLISAHGSKSVLAGNTPSREIDSRITQIDILVDALLASRP